MSKITDIPIIPNEIRHYGYENRIPNFLFNLTSSFPWITSSNYYWRAHHIYMLISAIGISFGYGLISKISCLIFSFLKLIITLQEMSHYNNHEYLYSLVAFSLAICEGHDVYYSFIGKLTLYTSSENIIKYHNNKFKSKHNNNINNINLTTYFNIEFLPSMKIKISIFVTIIGTLYLMFQNSVYGISGWRGVGGMLFIFSGVYVTIFSSFFNIEDKNNCCDNDNNKEDNDNIKDILLKMNKITSVPVWNIWFMR
jgi:hypothetical protein